MEKNRKNTRMRVFSLNNKGFQGVGKGLEKKKYDHAFKFLITTYIPTKRWRPIKQATAAERPFITLE
jgi:hypothetical protein